PFPGNASPVSSVAPVVQVADNQIWTYQLPAIDQNGDNLTYRLATNTEAGYNNPTGGGGLGQPTGLSVSSPGLITWDFRDSGGTPTVAGTLWTTQIMVEDLTSTGTLKSRVPVDFVLQITNPQNIAPTVAASPTGPFQPTAGTMLTFNVTATA